MLLSRVGVATCALGNSWLGARVRIPRPPGPQSIYPLADLAQLEATEYEDLFGEENLTLDHIIVDDRRSHQALIVTAQWNSQ